MTAATGARKVRGRRRVRPGGIVAWLLTLVLALISAMPVFWIVGTSFKTFVQTQVVPPMIIPDFTNFKAYFNEFTGTGSAVDPLVHSLIVATATTIVTMLVAIPAAFALARYRIRRKADVQFWIISSRMMPMIAGIIPINTMFVALGLYDTMQGLVVLYLGVNLSFATWLLTIFFSNVPTEIEQAAQIDGVSRIGVLRHVTIPLARSGVVVIGIFTWIFTWNELLGALVLTTGKSMTLPVYLSTFSSNTAVYFQDMAAVGTIQVIPAILITFFAQRYIVSGLSMGAISAE
jgi:ABC-type glycerol-3-phosphate transport system permease component